MSIGEASLGMKKRGDGPAVVLLHGMFGHADTLGSIARHLAADWTVYSLDLPGHGASPAIGELTLSHMASAVANTLAEHDIARAHFIGHSLGGKVVMQFAALYPQQVRSACVLDIAPVDYEHGHKAIFAAINALQLEHHITRQQIDGQLAKFISELAVRQFLLTNLRRDENKDYFWKIDFAALEHNYHYLAEAPKLASLYQGPVLVIRGAESQYVLAEYEPAFRERFSDCQFKSVEGVGHWLHAEKPDLVNSLIDRFLEGLT
ncbi:MAG: alpha/beta fold hydrolase [Pseudomonadales bacterium]